MNYLSDFVSTTYKYLDSHNIEYEYIIINMVSKKIIIGYIYNKNLDLKNFQTHLKSFDGSIKVISDETNIYDDLIHYITYTSNKILTEDERLRSNVLNYIMGNFMYDIERIFEIDGNLIHYNPFRSIINKERNFYEYQIEAVTKLSEKHVSFYTKLMNNIINKSVSHIYNELHKMETSGFLFYEDNGKVNTLIFNER